MTGDGKHRSRVLLDGPRRAPARSYFKAIGFTDEDLTRPLVGMVSIQVLAMPTNGRVRSSPARSYFKAIGFTDEDLTRPLVGIANTWIETMPCNFHLRHLAEKVKAGVRAAGGTPMEFNTIAISDGETMGTEGMKTSLVSREVI